MSGAETALEGAILVVLGADAGLAAVLGDPLRLMGAAGPRPAFPYLQVVRHQSEPLGGVGVEASEHRIDLAVMSRELNRAEAKEALAAVRAALMEAELEMDGWRCVLLTPVFADVVRERSGLWQALVRMKAVVEAV